MTHGLQHTRLLCPPLSPRICSNSCPLSRWCHPTNSSSVAPFSSCPHSFPESGSFLVSQLFPSGSQSIGAPVSASVIPMNIQGWFPLGLIGLISLLSKGLSRVFSSTTVWNHQFFSANLLYGPTLTSVHDYWKHHSFDYTDFCQQSDVSAFNTLSSFVISFPSKEQVSFNFMAAVTIHSDFGAQENKICHCFHFFPFYVAWSYRTRYHDLHFLNAAFQANFFTLFFHAH